MFRQNMTSPISVLLAGVIVIILLLASSGASTSAIVRQQSSTPTWTPCVDDDSDAYYECIDFQDNATATADALTATADAFGGTADALTEAAGGYAFLTPGTATASRTSAATSTATTASGTAALTPTRGAPTPTQTVALRQTGPAAAETVPPQTGVAPRLADSSPTLVPAPADAMTCAPGVPVEIDGAGPPQAPLLLYFGERPVGGGSVAPNGRFALKLVVGQERAGIYKVTVRVRGTSQALRQVTCAVPYVAPTPLPSASRR